MVLGAKAVRRWEAGRLRDRKVELRHVLTSQTVMREILVLVFFLALLSGPALAHHDNKYHYCGAGPSDGIEFCPWEWSLGLAAAAEHAVESWGWSLGVDLAVGKKKPIWFGGGGRVERLGEQTAGAIYLEGGLFLVKVWSMRTHYED